MQITRENVLHVAGLAHLELTETEVETYAKQLSDILTYMEKLNQLDISSVEPMAQVLFAAAGANPSLREDEVRPCDVGQAVLDRAPEARKPYFRVPRVIER
jgi:aspartyl-tRNA(Asn)/glutamyl-tRNA(Gln) amidotransferase subunit C